MGKRIAYLSRIASGSNVGKGKKVLDARSEYWTILRTSNLEGEGGKHVTARCQLLINTATVVHEHWKAGGRGKKEKRNVHRSPSIQGRATLRYDRVQPSPA